MHSNTVLKRELQLERGKVGHLWHQGCAAESTMCLSCHLSLSCSHSGAAPGVSRVSLCRLNPLWKQACPIFSLLAITFLSESLQYVGWQLSCFMPHNDCIHFRRLEFCPSFTCERNPHQSKVYHFETPAYVALRFQVLKQFLLRMCRECDVWLFEDTQQRPHSFAMAA